MNGSWARATALYPIVRISEACYTLSLAHTNPITRKLAAYVEIFPPHIPFSRHPLRTLLVITALTHGTDKVDFMLSYFSARGARHCRSYSEGHEPS